MKRKLKTLISTILPIILCLSLLPASSMATFHTWATDTDADSTSSPASTNASPTTAPIFTPESAAEPTQQPTQAPASEAPTGTPSEYATPTTAELSDVQPEYLKVVTEPLVRVEYHYYDEAQSQSISDFSDYAIESSHSYYAIAMTRGNSIAIAANKYPAIVPANTAPLRFRVLLNDSEDITSVSSYDAAAGEVFLPGNYMGHKVTIAWYCPASEVVELPIKVTTSIFRGAFTEAEQMLTLPSNANAVSIPFVAMNGIVVSQNGIDLEQSRYSVSDGTLNIQASALGGDLEVTAYSPVRTRASTSVSHTRSADQIYYGYYTSYYTANGRVALCLDPN